MSLEEPIADQEGPTRPCAESRIAGRGEKLYVEYGPRGSKKERFEAVVRPDGLEVDGRIFSPSYAAVHCMRKAGSERRTANGWIMWRKQDGTLIDELVRQLPPE